MHKVALVYLEEIENDYQIEMIDATKEGEYFRVASIPFFAKHLAIGDLIAVDDEDGVHYFEALIEKSGHSTIRLLFKDQTVVDQTVKEISDLGAVVHLLPHTTLLIALDIAASIDYSQISDYLQAGEENQLWEFQEACLGWK